MSYLVVALLAASAGALFGAVRAEWPWNRPHPVRGTISLILRFVPLGGVVAGYMLQWDQRVGRFVFVVSAGAVLVIAEWLAPGCPARTRWAITLAWALLMYMAYGHFGAP